MFRFPLRTASQAECSDLSKETWSIERMSEVFEQFQVGGGKFGSCDSAHILSLAFGYLVVIWIHKDVFVC